MISGFHHLLSLAAFLLRYGLLVVEWLCRVWVGCIGDGISYSLFSQYLIRCPCAWYSFRSFFLYFWENWNLAWNCQKYFIYEINLLCKLLSPPAAAWNMLSSIFIVVLYDFLPLIDCCCHHNKEKMLIQLNRIMKLRLTPILA